MSAQAETGTEVARKIAISNIAWSPADDRSVAVVMRDVGVVGLEVAPTMMWPKPLEVSESDAACLDPASRPIVDWTESLKDRLNSVSMLARLTRTWRMVSK